MNTFLQNILKILLKTTNNMDNIFETSEQINFSEVVKNMENFISNALINVMQIYLEELDKLILHNKKRKTKYIVVRKDDIKEIITSFGSIKFKRTYYKNKETNEYIYLLDRSLALTSHQRIDNNIKDKICKESAESSYAKVAKTLDGKITKETIKNCVHLSGVKPLPIGEKKDIQRLYIEADEDHISLQNKNYPKNILSKKKKRKTMMEKLVYMHEGKDKSGKLKNPIYFAFHNDQTDKIWETMEDEIWNRYNFENIETVYIAGDGASWIKSGSKFISKSKYVLDEFHLIKYVKTITSNQPAYKLPLLQALKNTDFDLCNDIFTYCCSDETLDNKERKILQNKCLYIQNNWEGIVNLYQDKYSLGCSAEGHVSHILSERLSSRPKGWSKIGANKVSDLRVGLFNNQTIVYEGHPEKAVRNIDIKIKKSDIKQIKRRTLNHPEFVPVVTVLRTGKKNPSYLALYNLCH